jgi:L-threonylcarbamoyladenylate synthase
MSIVLQHKNASRRGQIIASGVADITFAANLLRQGDIVGMPTETVYGLAADATQGEAVARIYEAKGRPQFNPLISHVSDLEMAMEHGVFSPEALRLAEAFWPGPLTLVVPIRPGSSVCDLSRAGLDSIGLRMPSHPVARALIKATGQPLAAPSANRSGHISPTTAADVVAELAEKVSIVLDGGACSVGLESTILACLPNSHGMMTLLQLRPGGIPLARLQDIAGYRITRKTAGSPMISPGLLESHYAPFAPVRMNCLNFGIGDAIIAYGAVEKTQFPPSAPVYNLSPQGNLRQAASRIFSALRELDAHKPVAIAVMPIPETGLGEAINDRLSRAAAPRKREGV